MSAMNGIGSDAVVGIIVSTFSAKNFLLDYKETFLTIV
jgi:hypothetical protein